MPRGPGNMSPFLINITLSIREHVILPKSQTLTSTIFLSNPNFKEDRSISKGCACMPSPCFWFRIYIISVAMCLPFTNQTIGHMVWQWGGYLKLGTVLENSGTHGHPIAGQQEPSRGQSTVQERNYAIFPWQPFAGNHQSAFDKSGFGEILHRGSSVALIWK